MSQPDGKIVFGPFRGVFPNVFEPKPVVIKGKPTGDPIYGITALIEPGDLEPLKAKIGEVARAEFGNTDLRELKLPFVKGEVEKQKAEQKGKDGSFYEGMVVVKATSKYAPGVVGSDRQPIVNSSDIYSGAYYYAEFNVVAYDTPQARGVKCYLNFLMKIKDGKRLAGRSAADVFAGISGGTSDYDPTADGDEIEF